MGTAASSRIVTTHENGDHSWSCELCHDRYDDPDQLHIQRSETHGEEVCGKYYTYVRTTANYTHMYYDEQFVYEGLKPLYFYVSSFDC